MARTQAASKRRLSPRAKAGPTDVFRRRVGGEPPRDVERQVHLLGPGIVCDTEPRGHATPGGGAPTRIVVDASEGFIPLWARNTTLRWRFRERSMNNFLNPAAAKTEIRNLLSEALLKWGTAAPVKFKEDTDVWDFEIVVRGGDDCNASGCVLASAFFPDAGRQRLTLYPKMFTLPREEQVDTMLHEIGHIFGLRHFFAQLQESAWPSEIFGTHRPFSIMNYGQLSQLTAEDKSDLRRLYRMAWRGELTHINGTPIRFVAPYHTLAPAPEMMIAAGQTQPPEQPTVAYLRNA